MNPGYIKLPYKKFVVAHSEDIPNGRTLLMKIGKSNNNHYEVDIMVYEIDNDGNMYIGFGIVPGEESYKPHPDGFNLSAQDYRKIISALFKYGIEDER